MNKIPDESKTPDDTASANGSTFRVSKIAETVDIAEGCTSAELADGAGLMSELTVTFGRCQRE